ncbi:MAG: DUF6043 family protein [Rikenellaceae bacterium]
MPQKDYDVFLKSLKQWIADNQDDYYEFEGMMDNAPSEGYNSILMRALTILPKFQNMVQSKCNATTEIEIDDIVEVARDAGLGKLLVGCIQSPEQHNQTDNFIPAMLAWLYFGRSWEGMVERGEAILKLPTTNVFQKLYTTFGLKMIVRSSIKNGFRTKNDWSKYYELRKSIETDDILGSALSGNTVMKLGRKSSAVKPIIEFISDDLTTRQKQTLVKRIVAYIKDHKEDTARHIATMITALEHHEYLGDYTNRNLYESIKAELKVNIGSENLINAYLNLNNNEKNLKSEEIMVAQMIFDLKSDKKK